MRSWMLMIGATTCLLVFPLGSASMVETPLAVEPDPQAAEVGDVVTFHVTLLNASWKDRLAGHTYRVDFTHDGETEGADVTIGRIGNVSLDEKAEGTFEWTIPAEVDDQNVFVTIMDGDEGIGSAHIAVGDAPPIMFAAGGGPSTVDDVPPAEGGTDASGEEREPTPAKDVPGLGAGLLGLATLAAVLLASRRR
ncbi:MAG TPA: hypothetical protein VM370_08200 [Candidatus Thermoplasmatota archaeon]|nr:hypothetical protein [Candidatus Thermoplasmatota archaeon]